MQIPNILKRKQPTESTTDKKEQPKGLKNEGLQGKQKDDDKPNANPSVLKSVRWELEVTKLVPVPKTKVVKEFYAGENTKNPIKWQIFLMCGRHKDKEYWGIFLRRAPKTDSVQEDAKMSKLEHLYAKFGVKIYDPQSPTQASKTTQQPKVFDYKSKDWGIFNFLAKEDIQRYKFGDEKLYLELQLAMWAPQFADEVDSDEEPKPPAKKLKEMISEEFDKCSSDISNALNQLKYTDMVLKTPNEDICVHRVVLASRSKYFEKEINEKVKTGTAALVINVDHKSEIIRPILCNMYTGYLRPELIDPTQKDMEFVLELFQAALLYGLTGMAEYLLLNYNGLKEKLEELKK